MEGATIRDRIVDFRRVRASELRANPRNWRIHPPAQREAMRAVLSEVGYADALLARRLPDGSLELLDGHLRTETTPDVQVPVLIVDLDDREAAMLLAVHDTLPAMATIDTDQWADVVAQFDTDNAAIEALLAEVDTSRAIPLPEVLADDSAAEVDIPEMFQVVVECRDEEDQQAVYEEMTVRNYKCRLLTL